jgi:hypothetical protein
MWFHCSAVMEAKNTQKKRLREHTHESTVWYSKCELSKNDKTKYEKGT